MADAWIDQIFEAQIAQNGGVVRRSISDVDNHGGLPALMEEVLKRGFHLIETGDQYVVLCHLGAVHLHC